METDNDHDQINFSKNGDEKPLIVPKLVIHGECDFSKCNTQQSEISKSDPKLSEKHLEWWPKAVWAAFLPISYYIAYQYADHYYARFSLSMTELDPNTFFIISSGIKAFQEQIEYSMLLLVYAVFMISFIAWPDYFNNIIKKIKISSKMAELYASYRCRNDEKNKSEVNDNNVGDMAFIVYIICCIVLLTCFLKFADKYSASSADSHFRSNVSTAFRELPVVSNIVTANGSEENLNIVPEIMDECKKKNKEYVHKLLVSSSTIDYIIIYNMCDIFDSPVEFKVKSYARRQIRSITRDSLFITND